MRTPMERLRILLVIGLLVLSGCGSSSENGNGDASADLACTHFRNVARDYSDGLLTEDELRGKLQEVWNDARVSEHAAIVENSRRMLADITQGGIDHPDLPDAIDAFGSACSSLGL